MNTNAPLRVSTVRRQPQAEQLRFEGLESDRWITSYAMARPWFGDFCEEATVQLTGGERMACDARADVCTDVLLPNGVHVEVKSIGKARRSYVYDHRVTKYRRFMAQGHRLVYCFWLHDCRFRPGTMMWLSDLRRRVAEQIQAVVFVPAAVVHARLSKEKAKVISYSSRTSNGEAWGKRSARAVTRAMLRLWAGLGPGYALGAGLCRERLSAVYGLPVGPFVVHGAWG